MSTLKNEILERRPFTLNQFCSVGHLAVSGPRKDYCRTLLAFTTKKSPNWSLVSVVMYTVEGKLHAICEWTILNRGNICQKWRVSNKEWHIRSERKEKSAIFWFSSQGKLLSGLDLHLWKGSNFCRSEHNSPKPYPWMELSMVENGWKRILFENIAKSFGHHKVCMTYRKYRCWLRSFHFKDWHSNQRGLCG